MATTTALTTPSTTEYLVMRDSQEGLGENIRGLATLEGTFFCPMLVREDMEASRQPLAMTTSTTLTTMTASIPQEKMRLRDKLLA